MDDRALLQLLQEKTPAEFTEEELQQLRARLRESAELRDALADRLQWEEFLVQSLSHVEVTGEQVRARRPSSEPGIPIGIWGLAACAALVIFVAGVYVTAISMRPHNDPKEVAKGDPEKKPEAVPPVVMPPDAPPMPGVAPMPMVEPMMPPVAPPEMPPVAPPPPPAPIVPQFVITLPAAETSAKQAGVQETSWGLQRVRTIAGVEPGSFVEYTFDSPQEAKAELRLRYAQANPASIAVAVNGQPLAGDVKLEATGGAGISDLQWASAGDFPLAKGKNTLRLTGAQGLPSLYQIALATPGTVFENLGPPARPGGKPWPWVAALTSTTEPPLMADLALEPFNTKQSLPSREDLREWFAPVRDQRTSYEQRDGYGGRMGRLEGIAQLRAPLRDDVVLRVSIVDTNEWAWHFFAGEQGVTLASRDGKLIAWSTIRDPGAPRPKLYAAAATDDGRSRRTDRDDDAMDIRWRRGEILISRGDIELLRAPLLEAPTDIFFDGFGSFRGLALVKVRGDLPPRWSPWGKTEVLQPASLTWKEELRGKAKLTKEADGSIVFSAQQVGENEQSLITTELPHKGIYAVELSLEDLTPGPGFCLLGPAPPSEEFLRTGMDRAGKQFIFDRRWWDQKYEDQPWLLHNRYPVQAGSNRQWIRFVVSPNLETIWLSPDGVHWAQTADMRRKDTRERSRVAISIASRVGDARVRLRQITLRELSPLSTLADPKLVERAPYPNVDNLGAWQVAVAESRPADVPLADWRRACAVRLLGAGSSHQLGYQVLDWLLDDAQLRGLPPEQERDALAAAVVLADAPDFPDPLERVNRRLLALGNRIAANGEPAPYSFLRRALLETPQNSHFRFETMHEPLLRHELLSRLAASDAAGVRTIAKQLAYFEQGGQVKLAPWAYFAASQVDAGLGNVVGKPEWRHPLVEELSKETYNVLAEFQAVVDSNSPQDAARMIAQVEAHVAGGLAPSGTDKQLAVSIPVAFAAAMQRDAKLRAAMQELFGASAHLRVRQAIGEGNPIAIELATVRYYGTEAAAEAHRWLGDRALSGGQFAIALHHYGRANDTAGPALRGEIAPRARLAAAMLGRDFGRAVTTPVQLGDVRMSAAEFEALVAESRQGHLAAPSLSRGRGPEDWGTGIAPATTGFRIERRSRLDGERGNDPQNILQRHVRQFNVPWLERQIAVTISDHTAYVSNRFMIAAIDLTNGNRKWMAQPLAALGGPGRAGEWPLIAMRPIVTDKVIYARLLGTQNNQTRPLLVALARDSGNTLWSASVTDGELVSDPILRDDILYVFTTRQPEQGDATLRLTQYDSRGGQLIGHQQLAQLRDTWKERRMCEPTALDDGIVANLGGAVVCCDWSGRLRWLRRELLLPAEEEPRWVAQTFDRPLQLDDMLILTQPGVRNISAVDVDTGTLRWRTSLPSIERLLGAVGGKLIVRTGDGLVALDVKSGALVWRCELSGMLEGCLVGGPGGIVVSRRIAGGRVAAKGIPELVWIAPDSGRLTHRATLGDLEEIQPHFGPLIADDNKLFAVFGKEPDDGFRDFLELVPQGNAEPIDDSARRPLLAQPGYLLPSALQKAVRDVLPGWNLLACEPGDQVGLAGEIQGELSVLGLRGRNTGPAILARVLAPGENVKKAKFRVGFDANLAVTLTLRVDGKVVGKQDYTQQSHPVFWRDWEIEIPGGAAPGAEIMLLAEPTNPGANGPIYFKRIELKP